ncbi:MAG: PQQ-binding-like beta-propeller repeat protein, partial [Planctomycetota bacterium]|nr:PQQ-binding-like beta-propeller repeat protein [Planctomycetota bacterium]
MLVTNLGLALSLVQAQDREQQGPERLWNAARKGDLPGVKQAIASGLDVNLKTDYGATALSFASDRGHLEIVKYLLQQKADPNIKDRFYGATPMDWAGSHAHYQIMKALVRGGANGFETTLPLAVEKKDIEFIRFLVESRKLDYQTVEVNLGHARTIGFPQAVELLEQLLEQLQPENLIAKETAKKYLGSYQLGPQTVLFIGHRAPFLTARMGNSSPFDLKAEDANNFSGPNLKIRFVEQEAGITGLQWSSGGEEKFAKKLSAQQVPQLAAKQPAEGTPQPNFASSSDRSRKEDRAVSSKHWPQFRGMGARGIADGQHPPIEWNWKEKKNVAWSVEVPGLGHSCPTIWGNLVFVTTAISDKDNGIRTGLYGDVASVEDDSVHEFVTLCFNKKNGQIVWKKTACRAVPRVKRHLKSTHANSTVATNGQYVVSWFGSEGIYCYTMEGKLVWKKELGLLDSGWFYDREYQWQFGASPVIEDNRLILLCDIQDQSFIGCYDLATGKQLWKTRRDEIPSWSTPTVVNTPTGKSVVTNATRASRGYDFETGKEIWRIERNSEIAVPTPFSARNLIFVSSGYRPIQPIYAIRLDARGDLTLAESVKKSEYIAWSETRGGPYMPSPIVYGDYLYICSNNGILTCYQATTG